MAILRAEPCDDFQKVVRMEFFDNGYCKVTLIYTLPLFLDKVWQML